MNIRVALMAFLKDTESVTSLVGQRIFPVMRPQGEAGSCIVCRVTKGDDEGAIDGDTQARAYTVELVAWATSYLGAIGIGDVLKLLFHGSGAYELGDATGHLVIRESWKTGEYDGDRVTDSYADAGDYAITFVFEFFWND